MSDLKYKLDRWKEKAIMWIAWKMPKTLVKYAFVRVAVNAASSEYPDQELPALNVVTALQRWGK